MIREELVALGLEESIVFDGPSYDKAIVGFDVNSGRVIYDFGRMIEILVEEDGMDREEAQEFIEYNTIRACNYMGDKAPIVMHPLNYVVVDVAEGEDWGAKTFVEPLDPISEELSQEMTEFLQLK